MRDSVDAPHPLVRDEVGQCSAGNAWRAVCVEVARRTPLLDLCSRKIGDGSPEAVACHDDFRAGILGRGRPERC